MKKSDELLLASEIQKLHRTGSCDYETLTRQIGRRAKTITYNAAQYSFLKYSHLFNTVTLNWARGVGKTFIIAKQFDNIVKNMPRSVTIFVVPSYQKFKYEMLPSLKHSLEMHGYYQGVHYFFGQRAPKKWKWQEPHKSPEVWDHVFHFFNGTVICLVSQDIDGSGRGLNADACIADEAAMLDKTRLDATTQATMRGSNVAELEGKPYFGTTLNLSSMPLTQKGRWFLDEKQLAKEKPEKYWFFPANVYVNQANLRKGYVEDAREKALFDWVFKAEYENEAPQQVLDGFYPLFKEDTHVYTPILSNARDFQDCRYDDDLWDNEPLLITVDFGTRLNTLIVAQLQETTEFRYLTALKNFFALGDDGEIQKDMVQKFLNYYRPHKAHNRRIIVCYDVSGNNDTGFTAETRAEMLMNQLAADGWSVEPVTLGKSYPSHNFRRFMWEEILKQDNPRMTRFRVNGNNCRELVISMQSAKVKQLGNGITKDKGSERQGSSTHPTHATHPSDGIDYLAVVIVGDEIGNEDASLLPKISLSRR